MYLTCYLNPVQLYYSWWLVDFKDKRPRKKPCILDLVMHQFQVYHLLENVKIMESFCGYVTILYMTASCLLTLNVRGPSYLGLTRSMSWLLMPWLLTSPGHQQPWYWLYRICRSFSYLRKCLCQINVEEWHKMQIYVYAPSEKFST